MGTLRGALRDVLLVLFEDYLGTFYKYMYMYVFLLLSSFSWALDTCHTHNTHMMTSSDTKIL